MPTTPAASPSSPSMKLIALTQTRMTNTATAVAATLSRAMIRSGSGIQ